MYKHLYDNFKHWYSLGGTIYFYSDPHFSDEEMKYLRKNYIGDEEQVKLINSKVTKKDTLIILGDIGNIEYISKLKAGKKILIMGNHDLGASHYLRNTHIFIKDYNSIQEADEAEKHHEIDYFEVDVSHKPFIAGYKDNRLFDEVYEGTLQISPKIMLSHEPINYEYCLNIHGHDHSNWLIRDKHLNMCAENINYKPICINEIIKSGLLKNIPDIHRLTIDTATNKKLERLN